MAYDIRVWFFSGQQIAENKNVKRESKAYSFKEQKLDMELKAVAWTFTCFVLFLYMSSVYTWFYC